jgi:hypothetical protein
MVDLWVVVLGYAFVLLVVQVAVYLYFSDGRESASHDGAVPAVGGTDADGRVPVEEHAEPGAARTCPHCGEANEASAVFSYCRECGGALRG